MMNTHQPIYQIIRKQARSYPERIAYDFLGYRRTYQSFLKDIDLCAAYLNNLGIQRGDIISLFLPNIPRALVFFYAINKIGAVSNFVHPEIPVPYYQDLLRDLQPALAVVLDSMPELIEQLDQLKIGKQILLIKASEFMPPHLKAAMMPRDIYLQYKNKESEKIQYYRERSSIAVDQVVNTDFSEIATILLTSGTTGHSKGVCLSSLNINVSAMQTGAYRKNPQPDDSMLAILPLFHAYGLVNCIHSAFYEGLTVILLPYFKERLLRTAIIKKKPNYILGVPKLYAKIVDILDKDATDLSYFKGLYCGGSKLSDTLLRRLNTRLKTNNSPTMLREGYGLTECVGASTLMPESVYRAGSVGLPYSGVTIRIMATDSQVFLNTHEVGRICIQSDTVMLGYYHEDSAIIAIIDGGRYLVTNDLGYLDDEGYVYFVGRRDRMLKISSYEIHPARIESLINNLEHVVNCCITSYSHREIAYLKAYVVINNSSNEQQMTQQILDLCNKNLPKWSVPREIVYIDAIPQTLFSKNDYRQLMN